MEKSIIFNPNKSLHKLWVFIVAVVIGVLLALYSAVDIWWNNELNFNSSYENYNGIFEVFKAPIQILVGTVALVALIAAFHKSEQTREQIIISNSQNNFVNYYKHVEEFTKYMSTLAQDVGYGIESAQYTKFFRPFHGVFFPGAKTGKYSVIRIVKDEPFSNALSLMTENVRDILVLYVGCGSGIESVGDNKDKVDIKLNNFLIEMKSLFDMVKLDVPSSLGNLEENVPKKKNILSCIDEVKNNFVKLFEHIDTVSSFDTDYKPIKVKVDIKRVPNDKTIGTGVGNTNSSKIPKRISAVKHVSDYGDIDCWSKVGNLKLVILFNEINQLHYALKK